MLELDDAAWYTKQTGFDSSKYTGKTKKKVKVFAKKGNAASMDFDGEVYFAYSQACFPGELPYDSYTGGFQLVGQKNNRRFYVLNLGDGIPRETDTEAKFLEFVADRKKPEETFTITILSEKHICASCQSVVQQFKQMFPNATVNIVSGKRGYNGSAEGLKTWEHRKQVK